MRLIDADKLIEKLRDCKEWENDDGIPIHTMSEIQRIDRCINFAQTEPIAFDVDKVAEELEERQKEYLAGFGVHNNDEMYGVACGLGDAIEIVKQGGVSDDVCEWRLCDEEANVYDTSCRNPHILIEGTPKENNYEYCPYCGKKIKVVE